MLEPDVNFKRRSSGWKKSKPRSNDEFLTSKEYKHGRSKSHVHVSNKPIIRFLEANLGRPWSEVYSELCAIYQKKHARTVLNDCLGWYLSESVVIENGIVFSSKDYSELNSKNDFYVDAGILQKAKVKPRIKSETFGGIKVNKKEKTIEYDGDIYYFMEAPREFIPNYDVPDWKPKHINDRLRFKKSPVNCPLCVTDKALRVLKLNYCYKKEAK